MVIRQKEFSDADKLQDLLAWTESKAIPTFNNTLSRSDIDDRRRDNSSYSRFKTQLEVIFLKYTLGHDLDEIQPECQKMVEYFQYYLEHQTSPFDDDFDQYELVIWFLSLCCLFNVDLSDFVLRSLPYQGRDQLIDRLINYFSRSHMPTTEVLFSKVYKPLCDSLGQYDSDVRRSLIDVFLDGYFDGLNKYDAFWHESHKERDPLYFHHFGYWVFELGALVIDAEWDDLEFRKHPLYPRDLVDWRRSKVAE